MPQHVTPLAPETGHRFPDRRVVLLGMAIHIPRVRELGDGGGGDEVDLGVGERFEGGHGQLLRERVHLGVFEELVAGLVDGRGGGVRLEVPRGEFVREVFARVEVFEEAGGGFQVVVFEVDGAFLFQGLGLVEA